MKKDLRTYFMKLYHYYRKDIVLLFFTKFISVLITAVCIQYLPAILLENMIDGRMGTGISVYYVLAVILFLNIVVSPLFNFFFKKKKVGMMRKLHRDLFGSILKKPMEWYDAGTSGEVLSHMNNDSECINDILEDIIPQICFRLAYGVGSIVVVFLLDVRFGIVVVLVGTIIVLTRKFLMPDIFGVTKKILSFMEKADSFLTEIVTNLQGLSDLPINGRIMERYEDIVTDIKDNEIKRIQKRSSMLISIRVLVEVTTLLIWSAGMMYSKSRGANVGTYTGLLVCIQSSLNFFNLVLVTYLDSYEAIVGTANIFDRYDILDNLMKDEKKAELPKHYEITVHDVSFGYGEKRVLDHFNLEAAEGEFIEIRGDKGCGKTTLVKLILGLYEEYSGRIAIGGMDIKNVELSKYISYVPANDFFFDGSICFNIALKTECNEDEKEKIRRILTLLCLNYESADLFLEKNIDQLSSGEKQRIAIARALFRDTPVIIMDEYNANLDVDTEKRIFENIKHDYGEETIFLINHKKEYADSRKIYL